MHDSPTHIVLNYKSQDTEILFRADDGICIGQRKGMTVVYGEAPNTKNSRVFLDALFATKFLREKVTKDDLEARKVEGSAVLEDRDGEGTILMPEGVMQLPHGIKNFN